MKSQQRISPSITWLAGSLSAVTGAFVVAETLVSDELCTVAELSVGAELLVLQDSSFLDDRFGSRQGSDAKLHADSAFLKGAPSSTEVDRVLDSARLIEEEEDSEGLESSWEEIFELSSDDFLLKTILVLVGCLYVG